MSSEKKLIHRHSTKCSRASETKKCPYCRGFCWQTKYALLVRQQTTRTAWVIIAARKKLEFDAVYGPYFFGDDQDRHITANGNRYSSMITEYVWPQLDDMDLENMCLQQGGATSHTANVTINLLKAKFEERVIARNGPVGWPPRSCDLTPLDYFLWGYIKSMVKSIMNFIRISNVKLQQYRLISVWKSSKIGFSVWTTASVPVVARQKKSSFIHNGIERTFTFITSLIL